MKKSDKVHLEKLQEILKEKFPGVIDSIIFYGSRATKNKIDSDFDLLVLTKENLDWRKKDEIALNVIDYGIDNDIVFDVQFYSSKEYNEIYKYMPFVLSVKETGYKYEF